MAAYTYTIIIEQYRYEYTESYQGQRHGRDEQ